MKVFLTGATGFVGHHVAQALAAEGADLRLLVRRTSNLKNLEGIRGETHVGDLAEPETIRAALEDCDAVMHVAADYRLWIPNPDEMYKANVEGTQMCIRDRLTSRDHCTTAAAQSLLPIAPSLSRWPQYPLPNTRHPRL